MAPKPRFKTARELFEAFPGAVDDMEARPSDRPSNEFLSALAVSPTPEDAITFCAYLLENREAVWWGHQCLNAVPRILTADDWRLLDLAEDWVRQGSETVRDQALAAGMALAAKTPGAWIALAAGWSGSTMLPLDQPPVVPPPELTAKAVNAGVLGLLARVERNQRAPTLRGFVQMGLQLSTMS